MKLFLVLIFMISCLPAFASQRVKRIEVSKDQIATVRTSLGIATIIQVPDRPNSVVVGDQDSFKVEYLDQAITIKPLASGAKSNLYIYTDWRRYNVELVSGSEAIADYVVYLESPKSQPVNRTKSEAGIKWFNFKNHLKNDAILLNVNRVGKAREGLLLIEFSIASTKKETISPEWLWLTQNGAMTPIHNLFLSSLEVKSDSNIQGVIQLREIDINVDQPIRLELRRQRISYLTVSKASSWKQ